MFFSIEEILEDAKKGEMFILLDNEDRENEGDLIILAEHITPEKINFMLHNARGLICLAIHNKIAENLELTLQPRRHSEELGTAFTTSIEARYGVTTGVSAHDRTLTIKTAIHPKTKTHEIQTPGHTFPIIAREGGVLTRPGHTEASVDIAMLTDSATHAAVICEIVKQDGSMARRPDVLDFAKHHNIKTSTVEELILYRKKYQS